MSQPVTEEEEKKIIEELNNGKSINKVAKEFRRSSATISKYAKKNNINIEYVVSKKAHEANSYYSKVDRMNLLKKGFEKAAWLLQRIEEPREYKDWSMGTAILIDKQRLEEGEPTEISDSNIRSNNTIKIKPQELPKEKQKEIAERYLNETVGV
mgnify:FL=1